MYMICLVLYDCRKKLEKYYVFRVIRNLVGKVRNILSSLLTRLRIVFKINKHEYLFNVCLIHK